MLNICMSSKRNQVYSWSKNLFGVIRDTNPSTGSGSLPGTWHETERVSWEVLAHSLVFMLFPKCLKQIGCICSQVIVLADFLYVYTMVGVQKSFEGSWCCWTGCDIE